MLEQIKILRNTTHLSMALCKSALEQSNNNVDEAIQFLRKSGTIKKVDELIKPTEGMVRGKIVSKKIEDNIREFAVVATLKCQTDFASKSPLFSQTLDSILEKPIDCISENFQEDIKMLSKQLGEHVELSPITIYPFHTQNGICTQVELYNHFNGKLLVSLKYKCNTEFKNNVELKEFLDLCTMQLAANKPFALDRTMVDPKIVEQQKSVFMEQVPAKVKNNQEMADKIVAGKFTKWFAENTLLEQESLMNAGITISTLKANVEKICGPVELISFERFELGQ